VRHTFATRPLRQRIIALVAAYAIALANLVAGFGAAQAAVAALDGGYGVICHSDGAEGPATGSQDNNGAICLKSCIGCISALTTVMPPTIAPPGPPQLSFKRLDLSARLAIHADAKANAHRSRGPPLAS
jgi:Protein of unknown function (DUF2946)